MSKSLRRTQILGFLVLLIAAVGIWLLLLGPRLSEPTQIEANSQAGLAQKVSLDRQIQVLERREDYLDEAIGVAGQLETRFPWQPDVPTLIEQVTLAGTKAGMDPAQVESIMPAKPTTEGVSPGLADVAAEALAASSGGAGGAQAAAEAGNGESGGDAPKNDTASTPALARMDVSIVATGTFEQISKFLIELRTGDRVLVIDSVKMSAQMPAPGEALGTGPMTYRVEVRAHTVLLPQGLAAPAVPDAPKPTSESTEGTGATSDGDTSTPEASASTPTGATSSPAAGTSTAADTAASGSTGATAPAPQASPAG